ncbi:MAG: UMP kinase [Prevotellaceae bacterium]|jgi:uridylate kinase|nr:UMP kinase [Prevotellaceae bacterium]
MIKYKRILLKLSGEALMGSDAYGISPDVLNTYAEQIKGVVDMGVQVGVVIGGGNIFRGLSGVDKGFDRVKGDQMGMLATVINSIGLQCALEGKGCKARTFTSVFMEPVGESFSKSKALSCMEHGYVAIIGGGTGNPFFTTDSASALRAIELEANLLLKGTRVDGVYSADPEKDKTATKFDNITYDEAYSRNLKIMDLAAFALCKDNAMPILVFDMNKVGNLKKIVEGENVGTLIHR